MFVSAGGCSPSRGEATKRLDAERCWGLHFSLGFCCRIRIRAADGVLQGFKKRYYTGFKGLGESGLRLTVLLTYIKPGGDVHCLEAKGHGLRHCFCSIPRSIPSWA